MAEVQSWEIGGPDLVAAYGELRWSCISNGGANPLYLSGRSRVFRSTKSSPLSRRSIVNLDGRSGATSSEN